MSRVFPSLLLLAFVLAVSCGKNNENGNNDIFLVNNDPNEGGPPIGQDGSSCSADSRCDGGTCYTAGQGWEGGYCTTLDCQANGCNGDDAECIAFLDGTSFCLDACASNADCRRDYRCRTIDSSGRRVCYRDAGDGPPVGAIGSDCLSDDDCQDGLICDGSRPGGYCIKPDCSGTCPEGAACVDWDGELRCAQACEATRDCRVGYICDALEGKEVCVESEALDPPFGFEETRDVLGIRCDATELGTEEGGTRWQFSYSIPDGTTSYVVVPFVPSGALRPLAIETPSGGTIDLVEDYVHHNLRATEFQFFDQESQGLYGEVAMDWPIQFPFAPKHADLVEAGTHQFELLTSTDQPCHYVVATSNEGATVNLDVYFVGLPGFDAESASRNQDLTQVFNAVDNLLGEAGVRLGDIQFFDAPREIGERYAFVRSFSELKRATAFGKPRDATLEGHLTIDIFLVQDLSLDGAAVLGLSAGLPGPPGMHGNSGNGLIFTGADIGADNDFVGHIMAHELGHYLGLRHTTEVIHNSGSANEEEFDRILGATDPIEDTPVCSGVLLQGFACPDADNLMFPAAPQQPIDAVITEGQAMVLRANPTLRPAE